MTIIALLLSLVIWGLIFYILYWGKAQMALGEPWDKVITVILVLAAVVIIIGLLMGNIAPFGFLTGALHVR